MNDPSRLPPFEQRPNPYAAPVAALEAPASAREAAWASWRFKPMSGLAKILTALLVIESVFLSAQLVWDIGLMVASHRTMTSEPAETLRLFINRTLAFYRGGRVVLLVLFMWFLHRGTKNAERLATFQLRFSPAMAAGSFLIPLANLWLPFQAMEELWRTSDVPRASVGIRGPSSPLVAAWWLAFVLTSGSSAIFNELHVVQDGSLGTTAFIAFINVLELVAALLAMQVVLRVATRQEAWADARVNPAVG